MTFYGDQRFMVIPGFKDGMQFPSAFTLPKDSELTEVISFHLKHIKEVGLEELAWRYYEQFEDSTQNQANASALGYDNLGFPFLCIMVGIVVAFLCMLIECAKRKCM